MIHFINIFVIFIRLKISKRNNYWMTYEREKLKIKAKSLGILKSVDLSQIYSSLSFADYVNRYE